MRLPLGHGEDLNAKISPNLLTKITHFTINSVIYELSEIYNGYLITDDILEAITNNVKAEAMKPVIRDMKITNLLD